MKNGSNNGLNSAIWKVVDANLGIYVYTGNTSDAAIVTKSGTAFTLPALFDKIVVDTTWTGATPPAGGYKINVQAYAHQAYINGNDAYQTAKDAAIELWN